MSDQEMTHHAINYIEFSVTDTEAAKAFYASAFGWEFNDYGPEYVGIKNKVGEGECGGMAKVDSVATGGPLVILYSDTLEESQKAVETAGGSIVKNMFSFPGGRRFEFTDPSGNYLAVWSQT